MIIRLYGCIRTTTSHNGDSEAPIHRLQWTVAVIRLCRVIVLHHVIQHLVEVELRHVRSQCLTYAMLQELMFHLFIHESSEDRLFLVSVQDNLVAVRFHLSRCGINLILIVYIVEHHRYEIRLYLLDEVLVKIRAVTQFHTLILSHLEEHRFQVHCRFRVAVDLDAVFVARCLIHIDVGITTGIVLLGSTENLFIVLIRDGRSLWVVDVVVGCIIVLFAGADVTLLFLTAAFC